MLHLQSPQNSNYSKADLFCKQRSPSMRKRIPSMQQCLSSHHLKVKNDSPSEIRRRKSQHDSNNLTSSNGKKPRVRPGNNCTQDLMSSIQDLKEEYKQLRQAYKQLVQEKMKNTQELTTAKQANLNLKIQLEQAKRNEISLKQKIAQLENQLKAQQKAKQQLQTDLYFLKEAQINKNQTNKRKEQHKFFQVNENLQPISCRSFQSQSNILSLSLTSVLQESLAEEKSGRKRQHVKVVSNLPNFNSEFDNVQLKPKSANFKKNKKESLKIDITESKQNRQSKALSVINPLSQLLSLKSPSANDKKSFKTAIQNSSNGKRRKEDKENVQPKGTKKKSRKLLLQSPLQ